MRSLRFGLIDAYLGWAYYDDMYVDVGTALPAGCQR